MSDTDDQNEDDDSGKGKKRGGDSDSGAMSQGKTAISPAFFEYMSRIGASMDQITQILRGWTHLKGDDLRTRLADFFRDKSRASAHAIVDFGSRASFDLLSWFVRHGSSDSKRPAPEEKAKPKPTLR